MKHESPSPRERWLSWLGTLGDLARLRIHSWTIALGPLLAVALWRLLTRLGAGPGPDGR